MHASSILQRFLQAQCGFMHAKRQQCVARVAHAACIKGLGVVKLARGFLDAPNKLARSIKCCDRLLSNPRLQQESIAIYRALAKQILCNANRAAIIVDWSDLRADGSLQLLRASVMAKGRSLTIYEEVHPQEKLGSPIVQRLFMRRLKTVLPLGFHAIIITDAGFRAAWFKMLNQQRWAWIGRIRNRDMVSADGTDCWEGCKALYAMATSHPRRLGNFSYARANPVQCSLIIHQRPPKHRHHKTKLGKPCRSTHSKKVRVGQTEPWLLAVSPLLKSLSIKEVIRAYTGRMQIEQTFRDLKASRTAFGLDDCQTRGASRMAMLLLIGALASYALWIIGLAMYRNGAAIEYGSASKSETTISIVGLARVWLDYNRNLELTQSELAISLDELRALIANFKI